ncbi:MAG: DNA polymerase Y family protein [Microbacteriaceae bacterium]|nr:DNA polymerase Y family protein [Microbacteriaceae bacterium]
MTTISHHPERVLVLFVGACLIEHQAAPPNPHTPPDPHRIARSRLWREVITAVRQVVPEVATVRPGVCAMRARGPARYYGSEAAAARAIIDRVTACGTDLADELTRQLAEHTVVGAAASSFAAQLAALLPGHTAHEHPHLNHPAPAVRTVDTDHTAAFLAPIAIGQAVPDELAQTLARLGVRTLGDFSALPEASILQRFGRSAAAAHRRARGLGEAHAAEVTPHAAERELVIRVEFEPPLDGSDQLAFACAEPAEQFVRGLTSERLVCTELLVTLHDDLGATHARQWSHPANFTAADVVNRIRWQAATLPAAHDRGGAGIGAVSIAPVSTAPAAAHEPGLWSDAPDERIHHQLTRVQSLLGPDRLGTPRLTGGRQSANRQTLVPWGASAPPRSAARSTSDGPWPGHLGGATPNSVFAPPPQVTLVNAQGESVTIDRDELLSSTPALFGAHDGSSTRTVQAWSAPWPLREHWWAAHAEAVHRLQVVLDDGDAWLLRFTDRQGWCAEGRYA